MSNSTTTTPTQRLATILLGSDVIEYVKTKRADGQTLTQISRDLYEETGHQIDVSYETVRLWATEPTTT